MDSHYSTESCKIHIEIVKKIIVDHLLLSCFKIKRGGGGVELKAIDIKVARNINKKYR